MFCYPIGYLPYQAVRTTNQLKGNDVISFKVFRAPFAQPIVPPNYSKLIPSFHTPLKNVYLANIEQVYPWDRGTNYAVELGQKIANLLSSLFFLAATAIPRAADIEFEAWPHVKVSYSLSDGHGKG